MGSAQGIALHLHADVEELPLFIPKRREVHTLRQRPEAAGQGPIPQQPRAGQGADGEIAAVHGGDVPGRQGPEGVDIHPVIEVAPPFGHAFAGVQRAGHTARTFALIDDIQFPRRGAAQQVQPDVGGRGAAGRGGGRVELYVVRGQGGVHLREEAPGIPGQGPKHGPLPLRQGAGLSGGLPLHIPHPAAAQPEQPRQRRRQRPAARHDEPRQRQQRRQPGTVPPAPAALRLRRGHPFQQPFPGDEPPPEGAEGGVQHAGRRSGQGHQLRTGPGPRFRGQGMEEGVHIDGQEPRRQRLRVRRPGGVQQEGQLRRGQQAPGQVVQHAEAVRRGQSPLGEDQGQELPVAPCPAVEPPAPAIEGGGAAIVKGHVAQEAGPGQRPFDEIVGEHAALRQRSVQRPAEPLNVVNALAAVDPRPGQVHPEGRHRGGIAVHPSGPGIEPGEAVDAGRRGRLHPGLQHGEAPVQRMGQRPGEHVGRAGEHAGVGVQRHHAGKAVFQRLPIGEEGRALPGQQAVQVLDGPALPVPAHPAAIPLQQGAGAVEIEILFPPRPPVHLRHAGGGGGNNIIVAGHMLPVGIGEIAQQQTAQVGVVLHAAQRLQIVAGRAGPVRVRQQHGGDDEGPPVLRQPLKFQLQQPCGPDEPGKHPPHDGPRRSPARQQTGGDEPHYTDPPGQQQPQRQPGQRQRRQRPPAPWIGDDLIQADMGPPQPPKERPPPPVVIEPPADGVPDILQRFFPKRSPGQPFTLRPSRRGLAGHFPWRGLPDMLRLSRRALTGHFPGCGLPGMLRLYHFTLAGCFHGRGLAGRGHSHAGDGQLSQADGAGDALHLFADGLAGRGVHAGVDPGGVPAQGGLHGGEGLEGGLPVQPVQHAAGAGEVVQPQAVVGEGVVGLPDDALRGQPRADHVALQDFARARHARLAAAHQGMLQKDGTDAGEPPGAFHPGLRRRAFLRRPDDGAGHPRKAPQHGNAQRHGHGPQLPLGIGVVLKGLHQRLFGQEAFPGAQQALHMGQHPGPTALRGQADAPLLRRLFGACQYEAALGAEAAQALPRPGSASLQPTGRPKRPLQPPAIRPGQAQLCRFDISHGPSVPGHRRSIRPSFAPITHKKTSR